MSGLAALEAPAACAFGARVLAPVLHALRMHTVDAHVDGGALHGDPIRAQRAAIFMFSEISSPWPFLRLRKNMPWTCHSPIFLSSSLWRLTRPGAMTRIWAKRADAGIDGLYHLDTRLHQPAPFMWGASGANVSPLRIKDNES